MIHWTDALIRRMCDELAGGKSIYDMSKEPWCPSYQSIYQRMANNRTFCKRINEARAAQQEHEIDYCVKLADDASTEDWQLAKLRIATRQWRVAKLAPKKYGDKPPQDKDESKPSSPAITLNFVKKAQAGDGTVTWK